MIFVVVADPRTGRLLASQLRFYGAGDIPVYANAEIFDPGSTARDNDLNGFIFADTPALLSPDARRERAARGPASLLAAAHEPARGSTAWGSTRTALIAPLYANDGAPWSMRGHVGRSVARRAGARAASCCRSRSFAAAGPLPLDAPGPQPIDSSGLIGQR